MSGSAPGVDQVRNYANTLPKAAKISDPYHDWDGYEAVFQDILLQNPDDLTLADFNKIFAIILPAADYEEGVFYLQACFRWMSRQEDPIDSNLCSGVLWFIDHHRQRLERDGLLAACLGLVADLCRLYTSGYELLRLTDEELEQHGIRASYREFVKNSQTVHDLLDELAEYELFHPLMDGWLDSLDDGSTVGSGWWAEIAYHARVWYIIYSPGRKANACQQHILHRLLALDDYPEHLRRTRDYVRSLGFREYYQRIGIIIST